MMLLLHCLWVFHIVQPSFPHVTWEDETGIIRLGETVVLTCTVHEIDEINLKEARQWFRDSRLVYYNGQSTNQLKYMESLLRNQFKLFIYNVTEADLNCNYQCLYSFETYSKILEITSKNFEYPPPENTTDLEYTYANCSLSVNLHIEKVFPLPSCTVMFEAVQLPFTERTYTKKGLYYDVHLVHQSSTILKTSTQFNVTCQLLTEYIIATKQLKVDTDCTHMLDSDYTLPTLTIVILIITAISVIMITVGVCYRIKKRRTTSRRDIAVKNQKYELRKEAGSADIEGDETTKFIESQNENNQSLNDGSKNTVRKRSVDK